MENIEKKNYYTYGMIKPDGIKNWKGIVEKILDAGLEIHYVEVDYLTEEIIEENYPHCIGKDFYEGMKNNLLSGPVIKFLIYDPEGDAVNKYREVLGKTKSWEAEIGTIRHTYGNMQTAYLNVAHGSGNESEANDEIFRFFKENMQELLESIYKHGEINNEKLFMNEELSEMHTTFIDDCLYKKIETKLEIAKKTRK